MSHALEDQTLRAAALADMLKFTRGGTPAREVTLAGKNIRAPSGKARRTRAIASAWSTT
ncbi:hypothetical protein [Ottowia thiooxydans]|uniref:hypothetical protein n=1 Tax=Ottowia thiooxydans TaxID=219182 RepID=UPI0004155B89|nr:hypothetical protein [Ottowia thiooxydans]